MIHIKDARTSLEINDNANIYEETCYIDLLKNIVPICSFTYEAMGIFFDIIYEILDGPTEETRSKLDYLYEIMHDNYAHDFNEIATGDYHTQPWNPANYNEYQICLKMVSDVNKSYTNSNNIGMNYSQNQVKISYEGANGTIEDINIEEGTHAGHYKVITFDKFPSRISFKDGNYIQEVIHMCNTSKITDMSNMFYECRNLEYINTKNFDTSNVTTMKYMFCNCEVLNNLAVNNFNTSKVTNMHAMFSGCKSLTSIDVSSFDTSKVTFMPCMFLNCHSLITLDVSNFDTSKVTNMQSMFDECHALTLLNLSNFDTPNVTDMSKIFTHSYNLELSNIIMNNCSSDTIAKLTAEYEATWDID